MQAHILSELNSIQTHEINTSIHMIRRSIGNKGDIWTMKSCYFQIQMCMQNLEWTTIMCLACTDHVVRCNSAQTTFLDRIWQLNLSLSSSSCRSSKGYSVLIVLDCMFGACIKPSDIVAFHTTLFVHGPFDWSD